MSQSSETARHRPDVDPVPREARSIQGWPAGIVTRVAAGSVDFAVTVVAVGAAYAAWCAARFLLRPAAFSPPTPPSLALLVSGGIFLVGYLTAAWATTGRTYGDHLLGLRVVTSRHGPLPWTRSLLRAVACVVFPIGLFWAVASRSNRSVQDHLVRTSVVYDWAVGGVTVPQTVTRLSDTVSSRLPAADPLIPDG